MLEMPKNTLKGMAGLEIVRVKDGKVVKTTKALPAESTHPLLDGEYVVWETCQTFSGSWGYHRDEGTWKSPDPRPCT